MAQITAETSMPAPDFAALRARHPDMRDDWTIPQNWQHFTERDHGTWRTLYQRIMKVLPGRACDEFLAGVELLPLGDGIPDFENLSASLKKATGWQVVAVPGLVPDDVFFEHLANRRFPAGNFIRDADELDYIEEPDVFHDVFGHVPMLAHPVFADYMEAYGKGGLRAEGFDTLHNLARLYWYTVEFGLIATPKGLRIMARASSPQAPRAFMRSRTRRPTASPSTWSVSCARTTGSTISRRAISSSTASRRFSQRPTRTLRRCMAARERTEPRPGEVLPGERVHHRGDRSYKAHSHQAA
jgi:monomeric phenylalanine-4-hydroxylase